MTDYEASPFPAFRWEAAYRTYECSQCGKIVRWGQLAFLLDDIADDDEEERDEEEVDPLAYRHPKYVLCSPECLKSAESDHWEEEAADRDLWESNQQNAPARAGRRKARKRAESASGGPPVRVQPDRQTDLVAQHARTRHAVDEAKAEAFVASFSEAVGDICLRLEEAATVLKWADSQRRNHESACACDRCTLAKRLRGEFAILARAVRTLVLG